ncbi:hypothetical protein [Streptomyces luteolus]|uniref:Uncharacterized protein n=1 Tax=Streptomyces luteolus TaxID=3043615 RepID=A0ABT6SNT0_9ACTN|nr:hypothetical protein [Streptomyces sp. B-S-A12]MDI3417258.1 hypothetical protein [Streptomyces sp. B-S-A12]
MTDGTGYGIRAGDVGSVAGKLNTAADQMGTVKSTMPQEQCSTPAAMGGEEAAPAYDDFVAGWQREATVLRDALKKQRSP